MVSGRPGPRLRSQASISANRRPCSLQRASGVMIRPLRAFKRLARHSSLASSGSLPSKTIAQSPDIGCMPEFNATQVGRDLSLGLGLLERGRQAIACSSAQRCSPSNGRVERGSFVQRLKSHTSPIEKSPREVRRLLQFGDSA